MSKLNQSKDKKDKVKKFKTFYSLAFAIQLGFLIIISVGALMYLGFLADETLNVKPLFFIVGIIAGIAVAAYGVYQLLIPLISEND